jgi:sulfur-carrier protein
MLMAVELLYFAWVREAVGRDNETVDPPADVGTVEELLIWLTSKGGDYRVFEDRARLRCAVDQTFMPLSASVIDAQEVAIFPPVTGG